MTLGGVACEPTRTVDDGQCAIRVLMHPHVRFHVVRARWTLWKLKATAFVGDRVVARDDPVLLHAKNISKSIWITHLHKRALLRDLRRSSKQLIVHGKVDLADIA